MLKLEQINTCYSRAHILHDVSIELEKGECIALLGRNGAGKTTTLKTIMGLVKPASGSIFYKGVEITSKQSYQIARLGIGYVPEERRIFPKLSVSENLITGQKAAKNIQNPWDLAKIYEIFPKLEELKDRLGGQLSGGEQQMLTVARTLMGNPEVLLLDEPTEGLAPVIVQNMISAINKLKAEGLSVLLSEQNRHAAYALCDRAYIIEKGTIVFSGDTKQLKDNSEIEEKYLSTH